MLEPQQGEPGDQRCGGELAEPLVEDGTFRDLHVLARDRRGGVGCVDAEVRDLKAALNEAYDDGVVVERSPRQ